MVARMSLWVSCSGSLINEIAPNRLTDGNDAVAMTASAASGTTDSKAPALWVRLLIAAAVAAIAMVLADHPLSDDFAQVWLAARVMLGGGDPYTLVGPGLLHES